MPNPGKRTSRDRLDDGEGPPALDEFARRQQEFNTSTHELLKSLVASVRKAEAELLTLRAFHAQAFKESEAFHKFAGDVVRALSGMKQSIGELRGAPTPAAPPVFNFTVPEREVTINVTATEGERVITHERDAAGRIAKSTTVPVIKSGALHGQ